MKIYRVNKLDDPQMLPFVWTIQQYKLFRGWRYVTGYFSTWEEANGYIESGNIPKLIYYNRFEDAYIPTEEIKNELKRYHAEHP